MKTRFDQRNTIFSRMRLQPSTPAYNEYYGRHPNVKEADDALRGMDIMKNLRAEKHEKDKIHALMDAGDQKVRGLHEKLASTKLGLSQKPLAKQDALNQLREEGAVAYGVVRLNEAHYYTAYGGVGENLGRKDYGKSPDKHYTHAVVFAVPMDMEGILAAPKAPSLIATKNAYLKMAEAGYRLASSLQQRGYPTVFASEDFYPAPLVPLAYDAGIGEIGMANHIVHPVYGNRIRLGAVFTTHPFEEDAPDDYGVEDFCRRCALCLMNCPSQAIKHKKRIVNGRPFFKFDEHACFKMFKQFGTDCSICLQSCPFTHGINAWVRRRMRKNRKNMDLVVKEHLRQRGRKPKEHKELFLKREWFDGNHR